MFIAFFFIFAIIKYLKCLEIFTMNRLPYPRVFHNWTSQDVINFIEAGGNVDYEGQGLRTPLIFACETEDRELVSFLLARGANPNTDLPALIFSTEKTFDLLIEYGADIHHNRISDNKSLIYYTCAYVTKALIDMGVNINHESNGANILFHYSKPYMSEEKLKVLLDSGIDKDVIFEECNALEYAIYKGQADYAHLLLKQGFTADKNNLIANFSHLNDNDTISLVLKEIIFKQLDKNSLNLFNHLITCFSDDEDYHFRKINILNEWRTPVTNFHEKYELHEEMDKKHNIYEKSNIKRI